MNQFQKQQTGYWIVQFMVFVLLSHLYPIDRHPHSKKEAQAMQEHFTDILNTASSAQS